MCSSVAPWWLLGGSSVLSRCGSRLCFYCCGSGKTAFGRARTDQGPQLTHYIRQLMGFLSSSPLHALFFHIFSKKCSPPSVGSTFLKIGPHHFALKISLFRRRNGPNKAHVGDSVWSYRSVVRSFPFYPPHASQAGPQKTSQICVLLLQVASLSDFRDASDIILMTS